MKRAGKRSLSGIATIEGVGFFDLPQSTAQLGVSPNNIELHPLRKFTS